MEHSSIQLIATVLYFELCKNTDLFVSVVFKKLLLILIEKQCLSLEVNMFLDEGAFDNDDVDTGFNKMKVSNSSKLLQ